MSTNAGWPQLARMRRPTPVPVRSVWPGEASDFTPWLADNLDLLGETGLGGLTVVGREVPLPGTWRALDILAETADGRRVAIENQFGSVDHDHLTRGLAYAVGLRAAALVLIAEHHRPEFVAVADYLNEAADALGEDGGIAVFLVEVRVEKVEEFLVARLTSTTGPNSWRQELEPIGPARIPSVEAFLDALPATTREAWREVVDGWRELDGARVTFSTKGIALRLPKPSRGGDVAALTVFTDASAWLNRGYLAAAGEAVGRDPAVLDRLIDDLLPDAVRGPQGYYATLRDPSPGALVEFGAAVAAWLATGSGDET